MLRHLLFAYRFNLDRGRVMVKDLSDEQMVRQPHGVVNHRLDPGPSRPLVRRPRAAAGARDDPAGRLGRGVRRRRRPERRRRRLPRPRPDSRRARRAARARRRRHRVGRPGRLRRPVPRRTPAADLPHPRRLRRVRHDHARGKPSRPDSGLAPRDGPRVGHRRLTGGAGRAARSTSTRSTAWRPGVAATPAPRPAHGRLDDTTASRKTNGARPRPPRAASRAPMDAPSRTFRYATICGISVPCTSVRRMSRPL